MIRFEPGTVYDVAHLRPFDLELAKAGNPLATYDGKEVRLFRVRSQRHFSWDVWAESGPSWDNDYGNEEWAKTHLRLAPLAIKDGRGLHVGDEIEMGRSLDYWDKTIVTSFQEGMALANADECWRWPKE